MPKYIVYYLFVNDILKLNIKIQSFPSNIFAIMFNFKTMELFDLAENDVAQNPVEVKF